MVRDQKNYIKADSCMFLSFQHWWWLLFFLRSHVRRDYSIQGLYPSLGIFGSPWVGFKHFQRFFDSYYFWDLIKNTLGISIYSLVVGFPLPIILALALNELKDGKFKSLRRQ